MPTSVGKTICWAARAGGYRVEVCEGPRVLHTYSAGNNRHESQTYVPLRSANALSPQEMRWAAKRTAAELAREYKVPLACVHEDADTDESLKEDLRAYSP